MDRTDRHFRYLMRQVTSRTLLYTEMVTTQAILRSGRSEQLLGYHPVERPLSLQLGGDDPEALRVCAQMAEDMGYDEVNLNCGCPSDRVQKGRFGAVLMKFPDQVARCVTAMKSEVSIPVTVKHRIGVDDLDTYDDMRRFVDVVSGAGADRFTVHARKAWLKGLSPKENRTIPPLRYADVYRLKTERPNLVIELNGGVETMSDAVEHLQYIDAVMIGRAAYNDPMMFAAADRLLGGGEASIRLQPEDVVRAMIPYAEEMTKDHHTRPLTIVRHLMGLVSGQPGARTFRRVLSEEGPQAENAGTLIKKALDAFELARDVVLDNPTGIYSKHHF